VADLASSSGEQAHTREELRSNLRAENRTLREEGREVALSAVYDHLEMVGSATADDIIDHVYPVYPAGYGSAETWWGEWIAPELETFPDIRPPTGDGGAWVHRGAAGRAGDGSRGAADNWITAPDSDFMHREVGSTARGLHVEVSDDEADGRFFVDGDSITPESHSVRARNGEDWTEDAKAYLREHYC